MPPNHAKLVEVGNNIRKWRNIVGFKQKQMADLLEISLVSMSKIETGKTDIPLNRLFSIADTLGIKIELLFIDPFSSLKNNQNSYMASLSSSGNIFVNSASASFKSRLTKPKV